MGSLRVFWLLEQIFIAYHRRNIDSILAAPSNNKTEIRKKTEKEKRLQIKIKNEK
jgi:hypothetical protein